MMLDSVLAVSKRHDQDKPVTWGDLTELITDFQRSTTAISAAIALRQLNQMEIEFIEYMAQEKSTREIALLMGRSHRTVEAIRISARKKTGTKTNIGLVLYAIKAGIVSLKDKKEGI